MMQANTITRFAEAAYPELVKIRRDIHRHPELSGEEERTANIVAQYLRGCGLDVQTGVGGHGVVGFLHGARSQPVVAFRADMDALEIDLIEDNEYSSIHHDIGHGCGHDIHTVIALGAANVLSKIGDELPGSVKFIFQPSEESLIGAAKMLSEGVLDDNPPLTIFAFHVGPFECGQVVAIPGLGLPGIIEFDIYFQGERALEVAMKIEKSINKLSSIQHPGSDREMSQFFDNLVKSFSEPQTFSLVEGYLDDDSLKDKARVRGFIKASGENEYNQAESMIARLLEEFQDVSLVIHRTFERKLPEMINDEVLVMWALNPLKEMVGDDQVLVARRTTPFSGEDFALFLQRIPGAMFFLGASNKQKGLNAVPHSPHFQVDERVILIGTKCAANLLYRYLAGY